MNACAIVVLYEPKEKEIENILGYICDVDKTYILDNSLESNEKVVKSTLLKALEYKDNKVEYIHFGENIGLCKALNYGMKQAKSAGFEWTLIMDEDSSLNTNILSVYQEYIEKNDCDGVGVLAPVHLHDRSLERTFEGTREIPWSMTSGCFYNVDTFFKFNGFKEELFVDGLDIDYCYKIRRGGCRVVELADARINHKPGETRSLCLAGIEIKYGVASPWRYYMQARAIVWLIMKYHSLRELARYGMKWIKVLFLFTDKKTYIKYMIRGTKEGIELLKKD